MPDAAAMFRDPAFSAWWDLAYAHVESSPRRESIMGFPNHGWALDALIRHYRDGSAPEMAVDEIVRNYTILWL